VKIAISKTAEQDLTRNPRLKAIRWRKILEQMIVREARGALEVHRAGDRTIICPAGYVRLPSPIADSGFRPDAAGGYAVRRA
jgi:hypothetical protein